MEQESPRTPRSPRSPRSPPWAPKRTVVTQDATRVTITNNMVTEADKAEVTNT